MEWVYVMATVLVPDLFTACFSFAHSPMLSGWLLLVTTILAEKGPDQIHPSMWTVFWHRIA
jgi:hypothetical protein